MKFALLIFCLMVIFSCTYDTVAPIPKPTVEKTTPWVAHPKFNYDQKLFFSSYADSNNLYYYGLKYTTVLNTSGKFRVYENIGSYPYDKRLPINQYIQPFIYSDSLILVYTSPKTDVYYYPEYSPVQLLNYSKNFISLNTPFIHFRSEVMALNNMNQLLVPFFERITGNQMSPINKMLLLNIDKSQPNINSTIVINIPTSVEDQFIEFVQEVKDYFIVATGVTTYKVSSNGDTLKISDHGTAKVFTYNNNVYILDFYGNAVVSNNDWLSWHEEKIAEQFAYGLMQSIGDSLIFINNSNFYTLNFRPGYWFLRELENDGIDKEIVTTLTDFNDSIYSTTYSGVYYKSKKDFFKSKAKK